MNVLRKLALGVLSALFITLLFTTAFDIGFIRTATNPSTIKQLVSDSGIYNSAVNSLLHQAKSINTDVGMFSASDPTIQKAANQTISPQFIKQNTEMTIDSVYAWLNGKTSQPDFKIDLSNVKNNFADNFSSVIEQKLAKLPTCSYAESRVIAASGKFDVVNATCIPIGVKASDAAAKLKVGMAGNGDFLKQTTLSADNLKSGNNNQSIFNDKLKNAPKLYQAAKQTPLILSVLTILCGIGIVFLCTSRQKGLRRIGISMVVIGVLMLIFSYALNKLTGTSIVPKITLVNLEIQTNVRKLVIDLVQHIDKNYWLIGGFYTVLGVLCLTGSHIINRRHPKTAHPHTDPAGDSANADPAERKND